MKPAARRRVEREIRKITREDGEHCSLCRSRLEHNSRTFGGTVKGGTSVLTGECCGGRIEIVVLEGLYLDGEADDLVSRLVSLRRDAPPNNTGDVEGSVEAIKRIFDGRQADGRAVARRAGLPERKTKLFTAESTWKTDDAVWFEAHADRSHRLRSLHDGEAEASGFPTHIKMPERHEMQVLVRQIEPGKRARLAFGRNIDVPIPDDETVLHALSDIVSGGGTEEGVISTEMMRTTIARYLEKRSRPS
jgi:hypothetical protein